MRVRGRASTRTLIDAGADLALADAGYYAINSLRLDKGYRAFGSGPHPRPQSGGGRPPVHLQAAPPTGTSSDGDAVEQVIAEGPRRRLVSFRLDDPEPMMWGGELVLRDGEAAGQVTSAAWSETLGTCVGLAYVWRGDREADHRRTTSRRARTRSTWAAGSTPPPWG